MGGSLKMIKDPGTELVGRMRKRIGLFTLLAVLSLLLLPIIGTETAFSATPPVASDLSLTAEDGTGVSIYLSGSDPDGDAMSFRITELPTNGGVLTDGGVINSVPTLLTGNTVTFTGAGIGSSTFKYQAFDSTSNSAEADVDVKVIRADLAPIALDIDVTSASSTLTIFLSGSDAEGDDLTFNIESIPDTAKGVLFDGATKIFSTSTPYSLSGSTVTYVVNSTPFSDSFTYSVADESAVSSAIAIVNITDGSGFSVTHDVAASADINTHIFIALPGHDPDDDARSFIVSSLPGSGQLWDGSKINKVNGG